MKSRGIAIGFACWLLLSPLAVRHAAAFAAQQKKTKSKSRDAKGPSKDGSSSLTGCVDEQDGKYVLIDPKEGRRIAALRAEVFEQEGFAKYLGHRVTVRGRLAPEADSSVMQVRSIESLADSCNAPTGNQ